MATQKKIQKLRLWFEESKTDGTDPIVRWWVDGAPLHGVIAVPCETPKTQPERREQEALARALSHLQISKAHLNYLDRSQIKNGTKEIWGLVVPKPLNDELDKVRAEFDDAPSVSRWVASIVFAMQGELDRIEGVVNRPQWIKSVEVGTYSAAQKNELINLTFDMFNERFRVSPHAYSRLKKRVNLSKNPEKMKETLERYAITASFINSEDQVPSEKWNRVFKHEKAKPGHVRFAYIRRHTNLEIMLVIRRHSEQSDWALATVLTGAEV